MDKEIGKEKLFFLICFLRQINPPSSVKSVQAKTKRKTYLCGMEKNKQSREHFLFLTDFLT